MNRWVRPPPAPHRTPAATRFEQSNRQANKRRLSRGYPPRSGLAGCDGPRRFPRAYRPLAVNGTWCGAPPPVCFLNFTLVVTTDTGAFSGCRLRCLLSGPITPPSSTCVVLCHWALAYAACVSLARPRGPFCHYSFYLHPIPFKNALLSQPRAVAIPKEHSFS